MSTVLHFHGSGHYEIEISHRPDESVAGRFDRLEAMLTIVGEKVGALMQALDDLKAQMTDLEAKAASIESKADAAAAVLTTLGQRLIDEASVATDLGALKDRMVALGTEMQARADNLGAAIDAVPQTA